MVDVAQLAEHRVVAAGVESSNLSVHPKGYRLIGKPTVSKTVTGGSSPSTPAKTIEKSEKGGKEIGIYNP